MNQHNIALVVAAWLAMFATANAMDTLKADKTSLSGEVTAMTSREVTVKTRKGDVVTPVNQITAILYEGEPSTLNHARTAIANGRYEDALAALEKIDQSRVQRPQVLQDIEFYKALCAARMALRGDGAIREAGSQMAKFVGAAENNYHWLQANELVGDLLVANGQYAAAASYYATVGKAPWPDYQMRASVAIGRALLADGNVDEALKTFDRVIATRVEDSDAPGKTQQMLAMLGKARCLAAKNDQEAAIKLIQEVIAQANPENVALQAQAYNALGSALRKANKPQDALLAFLHVDVLYFASAEAHAEALANLAELWNEVHKPDRAIQARETLKTRYKNTRWAAR
jgi:tetratricopeptide (TPR) repeat protein